MKYFFLSDGWTTGRVWEFGGLWDISGWQRKPHMLKLTLCIQEQEETLWLYQVEDAVLMVEVKPPVQPPEQDTATAPLPIGQVVLKRLITAEQVIQRLCEVDPEHPASLQ